MGCNQVEIWLSNLKDRKHGLRKSARFAVANALTEKYADACHKVLANDSRYGETGIPV